MGIRSRLIALFVVAVSAAALGILWPVVGTASPARVTGSASYTDPGGDSSGGGPDVTAADVSDDSSGKISFTVTVANRPALTDVDAVQAFFDTDKSSSTGNSGGFDYEIGWIEGHEVFMRWDGSQFAEQKPPDSFKGSYKDGKAAFSIAKGDFGGATSFNFIVTTTGDSGDSISDRAPDGTTVWGYPTGGPAPPPTPPPPPGSPPPPPPPGGRIRLKTVKPRLAPAVAGKAFTVTMIVMDATTKKGVRGKVACQAKLNGKTFRALRHATTASGRASCTWKLSTSSSDDILRGSITEAYRGATAKRTFSTRIL